MAQSTIVTLMSAQGTPGGTTTARVGDQQPAASYYVAGKNLQTITWSFQNNFNGTVRVQASLATAPGVFDWFNVYTIPVTPLNVGPPQSGFYNLDGNYVWLRVNISAWSQGAINAISASY